VASRNGIRVSLEIIEEPKTATTTAAAQEIV